MIHCHITFTTSPCKSGDIIPEKVDLIGNRKLPIQDEYIDKYLAEKDMDLKAKLDAEYA